MKEARSIAKIRGLRGGGRERAREKSRLTENRQGIAVRRKGESIEEEKQRRMEVDLLKDEENRREGLRRVHSHFGKTETW
jgi:hypothetical protein